MTESFNLWGLALYDCAAGGCDVAAIVMGAFLVALAVFVISVRFLR